MPAFVVVDTKIKNPEKYEEYKALARPIAEKYGGQYIARGGAMEVMQDELWSPTRMVIVQFPTMDQARDFMNCEDYQPIKRIREENADCTLFILDGM